MVVYVHIHQLFCSLKRKKILACTGIEQHCSTRVLNVIPIAMNTKSYRVAAAYPESVGIYMIVKDANEVQAIR